ncbi:hypothetical protein B0H21DRAFT_156895 [Amylocystis lapponica]|nr:hypothetical protein B0H21DRAFT_156895 [Amylocystis lapponica]
MLRPASADDIQSNVSRSLALYIGLNLHGVPHPSFLRQLLWPVFSPVLIPLANSVGDLLSFCLLISSQALSGPSGVGTAYSLIPSNLHLGTSMPQPRCDDYSGHTCFIVNRAHGTVTRYMLVRLEDWDSPAASDPCTPPPHTRPAPPLLQSIHSPPSTSHPARTPPPPHTPSLTSSSPSLPHTPSGPRTPLPTARLVGLGITGMSKADGSAFDGLGPLPRTPAPSPPAAAPAHTIHAWRARVPAQAEDVFWARPSALRPRGGVLRPTRASGGRTVSLSLSGDGDGEVERRPAWRP